MAEGEIKEFIDILFNNDKIKRAFGDLGLFGVDYIKKRRFANNLFLSWGYTEKDISLDSSWIDLIHPEDQARVLASWSDLGNAKSDHMQNSYRVRKKNGEYAWIVSEMAVVSRTELGEPELYFGTEIDISRIKEAEKELAEAKEEAERLTREAEMLVKIGAAIASGNFAVNV